MSRSRGRVQCNAVAHAPSLKSGYSARSVVAHAFEPSLGPGFEGEQARRQRVQQHEERATQSFARGANVRCCPRCGNPIEKNAGCEQMTCGAHAHHDLTHGHGCGLEFHWNQARPYQPNLAEVRQPPGYSAISEWLLRDQDFSSDQACFEVIYIYIYIYTYTLCYYVNL